jgi:L-malate glycosyltransferase
LKAPLTVGVVCFPSLGGSGIIATDLATGLAQRGHRVHVIASALPSRALPACERLFFHEVQAASTPPLDQAPYALALASGLVQIAEDHGLDLVHVHYAVPHAASAYLARRVLASKAPRLVTTLHGTDVTHVGSDPSYRAITRFAVSSSDGITVPSQFLKREAYRLLGLPPERPIEVIPNFVDTERFTPAASRDRGRFDEAFADAGGDPSDRGAPVLFHVSSFRAVKRVTDLVDALAGVRRHGPARLMLVGDGPERGRLMVRARELGVARSICLLGARADFVDYLRHADAFLLPSESESFGVAALEALSCGVPVIGYGVGGLPEVVDSDSGRLVEPFDVTALVKSALEVVADGELRETMGRAGRRRAEERFRREPALARYEAHYRAVLDAPSREES